MEQHIQVPKMNLKAEGLNITDPYVYACIKKYMNQHTKEAFPSNSTLTKITGFSNKTILGAIARLEAAGYFSVKREHGKPNVYTFNTYKQFEIFSYDFLDNPDLTPKEKSYLVASQQFMFKNPELAQGKISFSSEKFANLMGLSQNTLRKYEDTLKDKEILTTVPIKRDNATGLAVEARVYDFEKMFNIIAMKFIETDNKLDEHDQEIHFLKQQIEYLTNELKTMKQGDKKEIIL